MAVIVALCTAMAALQELHRGISAAVGWLALGLVGAVMAAAFAVHAAMPAASCERRFSEPASALSRAAVVQLGLFLQTRACPHTRRRPLLMTLPA